MELNLTESPVEETPPAREEMRVSLNENPVVEVRNEAVAAEVVVAPPRVSLMALLEETDWSTGGIVGTTEMEIDDEVEEEKKDNKVEGKEGGRGYVQESFGLIEVTVLCAMASF
ncbi:hypothetical protein IFM89_028125 [Coptis chinensis]|uniref:Uncharacterized protein n=1 Tax=Coptis chinensis TaxID=261450 RepID=A0A835HX08_9MAGN|nr:hypothetical protein IFM89_028125 [Coptis chinensis]